MKIYLRLSITVISFFAENKRRKSCYLLIYYLKKKYFEDSKNEFRPEVNFMEIIKAVNLAMAFFLELAMIIAFGYFGFHYPKIILIQYILVILLPIIAMALWGYFAAPKSKHRLQQPQRYFFALVMFGAAIALLFLTGNTMSASVFAILVIINQTLLLILKQ